MTGRNKTREELCINNHSKHFPAFRNRGWGRERERERCDWRAQAQPVREEPLLGVYKDDNEAQ